MNSPFEIIKNQNRQVAAAPDMLTESDSDSSEGDFWRYRPAPTLPRPTAPDTGVLRQSEITTMTRLAGGDDGLTSQMGTPAALAWRSLGMNKGEVQLL